LLASGTLQHVVARPSPVLSKQLAYDIVKSGAPGDADWEFVYAGEPAEQDKTLFFCALKGSRTNPPQAYTHSSEAR
jgi:hypothetical protein